MSTKRQAQLRAKARGEEFVDTTLPKPGKGSKNQYVSNDEFREELIKCKKEGKLSDKAALMFMKIAREYSNKFVYNNPDDREDCISYALESFAKRWFRYDAEANPHAFAYFTTMCSNAFAKSWHELGKMKCPDSMKVPISDNIYSI